jgi:hypothetical protein
MSDSYQLLPNSEQNKMYTPNITFSSIAIGKLLLPENLFDQSDFNVQKNSLSLIPLIVYETQGKYQIIDGCKRYLQAIKNNQLECICSILSPAPDQKEAALLRIAQNRNRSLSLNEKLLYLEWLRINLTGNEYSEIAASLPITSSERHDMEKVIPLPDHISISLKKGQIDLNVIPELLLLDQNDQNSILKFFSLLQFSRSSQRELIEWVPEIAFRDKTTVPLVINSAEIMEIIANSSTNQPQKMQKIRDLLYRRRFPTLTKLKDQWIDLARKTNPDPSRIQLIPSEAFEKNRLEIKITISSADEILSIFEKLKNIPSDLWKKLIYPA